MSFILTLAHSSVFFLFRLSRKQPTHSLTLECGTSTRTHAHTVIVTIKGGETSSDIDTAGATRIGYG